MVTEQWDDRERAIWKQLPLHPQPQPLEAFTSYLIRLAEANGLKSMRELAVLTGLTGHWQRISRSPDYPIPSYDGLVQIAGCTEARVRNMTFFRLFQHFGRSTQSQPAHRFVQRSLASSLRYCSSCLREQKKPYYSLIWRFLVVPGCLKHNCFLLDQCGHCASLLPHVPSVPRLVWCPTCQGDLRTCQAPRLSNEAGKATRIHTDDLEMLLTPQQWSLEAAQAKVIGKRFTSLRQQRSLSIADVALLMGANERVIMDIEQVNQYREATFGDYMQYADVLEYSLREIFNVDHLQELFAPLSEVQVLEQVEAAVQQLQAQGESVTQRGIGNLVGMPASRLKRYPLVQTLLNHYRWEQQTASVKFNYLREGELVKQVEQTIKQLEARGETIALERVCALVGLTYHWMIQYPRIKALFRQYQESHPKRRPSPSVDEEEKVQQVQAAINVLISNGEPITLKRIRQIVRLTQRQLRRSLRVKALLAQYTGRGAGPF